MNSTAASLRRHRLALAGRSCLALALAAAAGPPDPAFEAELAEVRGGWTMANYRTPAGERETAFAKLLPAAADLARRHPQRAEALIWDGIVLSSYAGAKGGIGALGPAKTARTRFEQALAIDATAMDAAAYTSLGTLYHRLPGFPLAFGSDKKARMNLERAIQLAPKAIDNNYLYAEFLYDNGEYAKALQHLETAAKAPPRPGREIADAGRQAEIRALQAKVRAKLD